MPAGEVDGTGPDQARLVHESETIIQGSDPKLGGAYHAVGDSPQPTGVAQLDEFLRALVEIGLIDQAELESFAADSAEGVLGLSRALVKAGKLTAYQAAAVYQKKSRGLLIGNYIILDKLGQGGMGVVFKARHRRLGRVGALKILPPSFARDRSAVMRFRREVEAAGRLKHPNLVAAQDADEDRGVHFLVMDYVEGCDLDRTVRDRGPMQVTLAIDCLIQAARGLEAAHAQGIVHRDIKPGNLMLDNAGTVRVLDLGLARIVDAANPFGKSVAGRLTESGMYMGTVDYMAPEQAEDSHRVDHRADIYSLGCTIHYLLTGQEPFPGETVLKRLMAHMERPAPSLRAVRADVPPALDAVYLRMMSKRPEDRPASMTEVVALLEASKTAPDYSKGTGAATPKSKPELKVFNEQPLKRAGAPRTQADPSVFARPRETERAEPSHELNLEDLVMSVRPESPPTPLPPAPRPAPAKTQPLKRLSATPSRKRQRPSRRGPVFLGLGLTAVLAAAFVGFVLFSGPPPRNKATDRGIDGAGPTPPDLPPLITITTPIKPPTPPEPATKEEWVSLFDGKTLGGWTTVDGTPGNWKVEDGAITCSGSQSHLFSPRGDYKDFHYRAEIKINDKGNSGMYFRTKKANGFPPGYEAQVNSTQFDPIKTGSLHGYVKILEMLVPPDTWFTQEVEAVGNHIVIKVNGKTTVDYVDPKNSFTEGHFAFQHHDPTCEVQIRKVEVKELDERGEAISPPHQVSPRTRVILAMLDAPISVRLPQNTLLGNVLLYIKNAAKKGRIGAVLPVYVDPLGLRELGKGLTSPVTISVEQTPLKIVLQTILDQLGLAYAVKDDLLFVSSPAGVEREKKETAVLATDASPATKVVLDKLEKPIPMLFPNQTPLQTILQYIKQETTTPKTDAGIAIYVDPNGLREANTTLKSIDSIDLEGVPLKTTLRLLLKQLNLAYVVENGHVKITSIEDSHRSGDPGTSSGWTSLFDGRSLDGWEHVGRGRFVVDNGVLRTEGGMGILWYSRKKLGDCVIRVVFKTVSPQANSGVYIRIAERPMDEWYAVHHGYEVQILDAVHSRGTGSIYTFTEAKARPAKAGEWNTLEITLKGNRVLTSINGVPVAEFDPSGPIPKRQIQGPHGDPERGPRPESGYVGLQNHDQTSIVEFKEVSVRPLSPGSP
jgi:serine/threonine protein kinase